MSERALVLFSGGQDSTACLAWALDRFDHVETVGFDYGQRHIIELECRKTIRTRLVAEFPAWALRIGEDHMLDLGVLKSISATSLTRDMDIKMQANGLPNSFVPGRNLLFLTLAAALAYRQGIRHLVGGMCETDYSGYPDCRDATLKSLQTSINLGMEADFIIHTPLMKLTKADTWRLAETLGGDKLVKLTQQDTHTCYLGERGAQHEWGYGCGVCPACVLRREGYAAYRGEG
ncbi:MAG: 7-cyano-7-deazaguanine synthase QueC [Alphaproteobacteria bacterium]